MKWKPMFGSIFIFYHGCVMKLHGSLWSTIKGGDREEKQGSVLTTPLFPASLNPYLYNIKTVCVNHFDKLRLITKSCTENLLTALT